MARVTRKIEGPATATDRASRKGSQRPTAAHTDIARRAYELYVARGCEHGRDVDDWLRAERELNGMAKIVA